MIGVFFLAALLGYAVVYAGIQTLRTGDCGPQVGVMATLNPSFDAVGLETLITAYRAHAASPDSDEGCSGAWSDYISGLNLGSPDSSGSGSSADWFPRNSGAGDNPGIISGVIGGAAGAVNVTPSGVGGKVKAGVGAAVGSGVGAKAPKRRKRRRVVNRRRGR